MKFLVIGILSLAVYKGFSQDNALSVEKAIEQALKNNDNIKAADFELESRKQLRKTSFDLPKTEVTLLYGQYNSYINNDNNITISQAIPFSALGGQGLLNRAWVASSEIKKSVTQNDILYKVKQIYHQLAFSMERHKMLLRQDSIYEGFLKSSSLRYETGETNLLEQTTALVQRSEATNQLNENETEIARLKTQLGILINSPSLPDILPSGLIPLPFQDTTDSVGYKTNPSLAYMRQQIEVARGEKKIQSSRFAPDLLIGFFSQTLIGGPTGESGNTATRRDRFTGFQFGISLPLWFAPHQARVRSAEFNKRAAESNFYYYQTSLQGQLQHAIQQLSTNKSSLDYYTTSGLPNSDLILKQAQVAFREGEIGYTEYLLGVRNAMNIQEAYLKTLNEYNQTIIYIEYLTGNK